MSIVEQYKAHFDDNGNNEEGDDEYKFTDSSNNTVDKFNMGLGVYIITGIEKNRPITFNFKNNDYIEFLGLEQNAFQTNYIVNQNFSIVNQKYNYIIDNNQYKFYSGTVALRVSGDFGSIDGYFYLTGGKEQNSGIHEGFNIENGGVKFKSKIFSFDPTKNDGFNIHDDYLEVYEIDRRLNYNYYYEGIKINGLSVKSHDKLTGQNIVFNSYMKSYFNINKSKCMYIESNGLPNYHSYLFNDEINNLANQNLDNTKVTQIDNHNYLWQIEQLKSYKVYNYGINRQSFGFRNKSNYVIGKPFKIPVNIELAETNTFPPNNINKNISLRFRESFWYKGSKNWKTIMIDNKYDNINLGLSKPDNLLPLGPIGVAVNGIPFHSHFEMTNDIQNRNIPNFTDIDDPIIQREIILNTINYKRNDIVVERNYDNFGGTIDRNFSYFYNKYPVGLEKMIKDRIPDEDFIQSLEFFTKDIDYIYLNVSDSSLSNYEFKFLTESSDNMSDENVEILNRLINIVGEVGKGSSTVSIPNNSSYISLDLRDFNNYLENNFTDETFTVSLVAYTGSLNSNPLIFTFKTGNPDTITNLKNTKYIYKYLYRINNSLLLKNGQLINDINSDTKDNNGIYQFINEQVVNGNRNITSKTDNFGTNNIQINGNNIATEGGSGSGCTVNYTINQSTNRINSVTISNRGNGYQIGDILTITGTDTTFTVTEISSPGHSPILGWAFDGFPIYGQIGYKNDNDITLILLKSSYDENKLYKQRFLDNNRLDPAYLDFCNGRFSKTPEFPEGIYHYVCTLNVISSNEDGIGVDLNNSRNSYETIYAYPYVIGAYKGIPDIDNFDLVSFNNSFSTSKTGNDYNSVVSDNLGQSSELIVNDYTNYEINLRSLKPREEIFNSKFCKSINIIQNQNFINFQQGEKPYIYNFTGRDDIKDINFGNDINNFGNKLSILASSQFEENKNLEYLKAYGTVYKFKFEGVLNLGDCVSFKDDETTSTQLLVHKSTATEPLLGVVVRKDSNICYVCVKGLCEVNNVNSVNSNTDTNKLLKFDGTNITLYTTTNNSYQFILGSYIKNGSRNHLININTRIIYG